MEILNYTLKEKKIITILMIINFFALSVNYFGLKGEMDGIYDTEVCVFTNCKSYAFGAMVEKIIWKGGHLDLGDKTMETLFNGETFQKNSIFFWPFVKFTESKKNEENNKTEISKFRGIFCFYDFTEFVMYTILIFGIPVLSKFLKRK